MLFYQFLFSLCICINFNALIDVFAKGNYNETEYEKTNEITLPAYIIASKAHLVNNSIKCEKELRDFRDAIDQRILWSLKMLDSSGGYKPGFLYGNNYWLGSHSQCLDTMNTIPLEIATKYLINNTKYRDLQEEFPPFKVNYFIAHFKHNSTLQYHFSVSIEDLITLGLCLPASCSINDLNLILEKIFQDRAFFISNLYSVDFKLVEIKNLKNDQQWLPIGSIFFICVLVLTFSFIIIGTIYDIFVHQKYLIVKERTTTSVTNTSDHLEVIPLALRGENKIGQILMCFSIYTNMKIICSTKLNADAISVIHGLKFLCMSWIIIIHTEYFMWDYIDNKALILRFVPVFFTQVLGNIVVPTDTYFFSSGFLVAYLYLKDKINKGNPISVNYKTKLNEFFLHIIKRFIRYDEQYRLANVLYYPPWIRIGPFIIGIITGYIIRRISRELVLKKKTVILCWCFTSFCFTFVLLGLYKPHVSILYTAIYVALSRTLWAIGTALIVIACFIKHGGFVNQLLSLKIMIPLSKLTYCVYLINPFVIQSIRLSSETSVHLEFLPLITLSMGYLILSYFGAFILSLMAEIPYILLIKMFFQFRNNKKDTQNV